MRVPARTRGVTSVLASQSYFVRRLRPVQEFVHTEELGAIALLLSAGAAVVWVNSPWSDSYHELWGTTISFDFGLVSISKDLEHWVNDGLMALFFFVVGLEIKREVLHGELSSVNKAVLPVLAAIGGMMAPALIFVAFNAGGEGADGWGVPMATDIAFAMGVLGLLGRRLPAELRVFLLGLAVVDDLGAIAVIAVFYTDSLQWGELGLAAVLLVCMAGAIRFGVRNLTVYAITSALVWLLILESGLHATIAGVLIAAITPARPHLQRRDFADTGEVLMKEYRIAVEEDDGDKAEVILGQIGELSQGTEAPLERMERVTHPWTSFIVLPLFALANAGIVLSIDVLRDAVSSPVTVGVLTALSAGNVIGIFGMTWLGVRLGVGRLPTGVTWPQLLGVSLLGGIGFTVAIFVSGIAFDDPALVEQSKLGVFGASVFAGAAGYLFLRFVATRGAESGPEVGQGSDAPQDGSQ